MASLSPESSFNVVMMGENGGSRTVNIMTEAGANAFIGGGEMPFITENLEGLQHERRRLARTNLSRVERRRCEEQIVQQYVMFGCLADHASTEVFASIPLSEHSALISHIRDVLVQRKTDNEYTKRGVLSNIDQECLDCLISCVKQADFAKALLETDFLNVLAEFCAAAKPSAQPLPCAEVSENVLLIVNNLRVTLSLKKWPKEKILKAMESTGLLGQAIRLITQPRSCTEDVKCHLHILEMLQCPAFTRKKLRRGTTTGDILDAVIRNLDGHQGPRHPLVMARLNNLKRFAECANDPISKSSGGNKHCRNCNKSDVSKEFQKKLLVCSRCKQTYYCCRACQISDCKAHKRICRPPPKDVSEEKNYATNQNTIMATVQKYYFEVMDELVKVVERTGVPKKDQLLELDFFADHETGSAPALRDPAEFKIAPAVGYYEGSRPNEPAWLRAHRDTMTHEFYESNVRNICVGIQDHHGRMTDDHLLVFARYADGNTGIYRLLLHSEETMVPMFGNGTFDAFKACLNGNDGALGGVYGREQVTYILNRRDYGLIFGNRAY